MRYFDVYNFLQTDALKVQEGGFAGGLESQDEKTFYYRGSFQIQQRVLTYAFDETVESFCTCQKVSFHSSSRELPQTLVSGLP